MSNFPATQPTLVMPFSGMDTPTRMNQLLDSWGATFTRATTATYINKLGLVESVASGLPRPNFDSVTKENKGILIEEARTNLVERSEEFDNAYWTKTRCTVTANQEVAPDGETTADQMTATGNDARLEVPVVSADSRTKSIYVKSATGSDVSGQLDFSGLGIVSFTANNEWQRIIATFDNSSFKQFRLRITNSGDSLYIWGAQLEEGSFPTSYIPTTSASVTRNADECSISSTAFSDFYNQSEGSFLVEWQQAPNNSDGWISFTDGTNDNRLSIASNSTTNRIRTFVASSGSIQNAENITVSDLVTEFNKVGAYFGDNTYRAYHNGTALFTEDTSFTMPLSVNSLVFNASTGVAPFNGFIKRLTYYPSTVTDAQLQKLTRTT